MGLKIRLGLFIDFFSRQNLYIKTAPPIMDAAFLAFLPPPPSIDAILEKKRKARGPTRRHIASVAQLIVETNDDEKMDDSSDEQTEYITHARNSRNEQVLLKVCMQESQVGLRVVPNMIRRSGRAYPERCRAISCWWCKSRFATRPIGCPLKYLWKDKVFLYEGIFCSYS